MQVLESRSRGSERRATTMLAPMPRAVRWPAQETPDPWVIVLAGGEGRRLQDFTKLQSGQAVPKQFCHFRDERTLLGGTIDRSLRIAPRHHVFAVVIEAHRRWWENDLATLDTSHVLVQPRGRGTAVAILHALLRIREIDPYAQVVVMPSDHDFEQEEPLLRSIASAVRVSDRHPDSVVLLGIPPSHVDSEYGLITPGESAELASRPVRAFVEKPSLMRAAELAHEGALWNSFIFTSRCAALLKAFERSLPALTDSYRRRAQMIADDPDWLRVFFDRLPDHDFCRDVLERDPAGLRVVEVPDCGWTDLGTPARLAAWLDRHREAPFWREYLIPRYPGSDGGASAFQAGGA